MTLAASPSPREGPEPAPTPLAFLAWLGFILLLSYALILGGGTLGMFVASIRAWSLAIIGIALAAWLMLAWRRPEWRPTTAIWPSLVAPLAAFGLSISVSQHQRIGLDFMAYAVLLVALYLLLVRIMARPYARARIGGLMAALTILLTTIYVGWSFRLWSEWWDLVGDLRMPPLRPELFGLTWGSPSVVFTVLVLMTVASIGGLGVHTRGRRVTVAVLVLALAIAGFVSGSRSGWLAISGAIVITGALALLDSRGRALAARAWARRGVRLGATLALAVAALVAIVLGPAVLNRLGQGDAGRLELWATALRMFEDAPLLGFGPGSWMIRRMAYQEAGELNWYQPHAHSQYFQTAAELGVVGLAAGAIAFGAVGWLLYRAIGGADPERRRWAWASLFGLVYLGLNVFVDTHVIPTVALLIGLPIAVLDATTRRGIGLPFVPFRVGCWLRNAALVLLGLMCVMAVQQLARSEIEGRDHSDAVAAIGDGRWDAAVAPALRAADANPEVGAYALTAALALAATGDWPAAERYYAAAARVDQLPASWLGLARARAELGRPAGEVEAALTEALRLGEQEPANVLAAAGVYDIAGLIDEADATYRDLLVSAPSLASDRAWREALGEERFASIVAAAMAQAPDRAWEIALMAGWIDRASELAAAGDDAAWQEAYIAAREGDQAAYERIREMTEAALSDSTRLAPAARLADHLGDTTSASRYRRLMRLGPYFGPETIDFGYGLRRPLEDASVGTYPHYGAYTYRRSIPVDRLPPGLPGLVQAKEGEHADRAE